MKTYSVPTLAAVLLLAGCGSPSSSGGNSATTSQTNTSTPVALGTTGSATGVDFTVKSVKTTDHIGSMGVGPKADKGETFVVITYALKDTGDKPMDITDRPSFELVDGPGRNYSQDVEAGVIAASMLDDPTGVAASINPNTSLTTVAAWKVDKTAFDRGTWKLVVATDPTLTFALK